MINIIIITMIMIIIIILRPGSRQQVLRQGDRCAPPVLPRNKGYSLQGGCSGRGVQWIGVVLYNKLVYDII